MRKKVLIPTIIILLLLLAAGIGLSHRNKTVKDTYAERPVPVELATVKKGDLLTSFTYSGTVQDKFSAALSAKANAEVKAVYVAEGNKVAKGTVLIELDHHDFNLKLETLNSQLRTASINADYCSDMLKKYEMLLDEGAISQQQYDEADLKFRLAQAEMQTIEANIKEVEAVVDSHYIKAPRDGIVTGVLAQQGDMAMPGKPLVSFSGGKSQKIVASVIQEDLEHIDKDSPAVVTWGQQSFDTNVSRILPSIDPVSNTATVEMVCEEEGLSPGMTVEVSFVINPKKGVLLIPSEAVLDKGDGTFVYVVQDNIALLTEVTIGIEDNGFVEVVSGLEEGQDIACGELNLLRDNGSIYVVGGEKS